MCGARERGIGHAATKDTSAREQVGILQWSMKEAAGLPSPIEPCFPEQGEALVLMVHWARVPDSDTEGGKQGRDTMWP